VAPEQFRHGYLTVTLNRLFGVDEELEGPTFGLEEALTHTIRDVAGVDDPDAPLGSSSVLLITAGSFGDATPVLSRMAHQSAVAGVPVSVVGVGGAVQPGEIDRLILSGQGNRRLLGSPAEASELIERELSAVSRAVARAVRLRIRLAPGVRLIDVVGSVGLDEIAAERVRDAEQSIDLAGHRGGPWRGRGRGADRHPDLLRRRQPRHPARRRFRPRSGRRGGRALQGSGPHG
jgi:hypothetical protein